LVNSTRNQADAIAATAKEKNKMGAVTLKFDLRPVFRNGAFCRIPPCFPVSPVVYFKLGHCPILQQVQSSLLCGSVSEVQKVYPAGNCPSIFESPGRRYNCFKTYFRNIRTSVTAYGTMFSESGNFVETRISCPRRMQLNC